jgi:plasmid stabilization system protein ParE
MNVVLSARVEADIARQLQYGIDHFGRAVAERTFARGDSFLFSYLANRPDAGRYLADRDLFEAGITKTPFVIFYRVDADARTLTVVGFFYRSQDRSVFDPDLG